MYLDQGSTSKYRMRSRMHTCINVIYIQFLVGKYVHAKVHGYAHSCTETYNCSCSRPLLFSIHTTHTYMNVQMHECMHACLNQSRSAQDIMMQSLTLPGGMLAIGKFVDWDWKYL